MAKAATLDRAAIREALQRVILNECVAAMSGGDTDARTRLDLVKLAAETFGLKRETAQDDGALDKAELEALRLASEEARSDPAGKIEAQP